MRIMECIGRVTLSRWEPSLTGASWKLAVPLLHAGLKGESEGRTEPIVIFDEMGAGNGSLMRTGALPLRPGVARLLRAARSAGLRQGIVTTSGRAAVEALCQGLESDLAAGFDFWICGEEVARKKPDPEAYRLALGQLALGRLAVPAGRVLAVEDSANGVQAAAAAGLTVLVTRSASSAAEADAAFDPAAAVLDQLGEVAAPLTVQRGPACPGGQVTLSYLQQLLPAP